MKSKTCSRQKLALNFWSFFVVRYEVYLQQQVIFRRKLIGTERGQNVKKTKGSCLEEQIFDRRK